MSRTYTAEAFGSDEITPVTTLEPGLHLLHLSNGPTLAFKDIAMQLLGSLFEYVLAQRGEELNILGATSGDTGSAAEYAMKGKRGVRVFMLSPQGKMSPFQTAQMYSLQDAEHLQHRGARCVRRLPGHGEGGVERPRVQGASTTSAPSTRSTGRGSMAQVVYYFKGYFAVTASNEERVTFAVPSGNFGNVCAGHVARMMGLPIAQLIVATNENDVLDEFFRTGRYRVRGVAGRRADHEPVDGHLEGIELRALRLRSGGRDPRVRGGALGADRPRRRIRSGRRRRILPGGSETSVSSRRGSSHQDRLATIRRVYEQHGVIVDTHTADGIKAGLEHREAGVPLVCLETAQPAKFAETIREALGRDPDRPAAFVDIERRPLRFDSDGGRPRRDQALHRGPRPRLTHARLRRRAEVWTPLATDEYIFGTAPNRFLVSQSASAEARTARAERRRRRGSQQRLARAAGSRSRRRRDLSACGREGVEARRANAVFESDWKWRTFGQWNWPAARYDVIAAIFIQFASPSERAMLFRDMRRALKPGGLLILEGYGVEQIEHGTGGPPRADHLYTLDMLRDAFGEFEILLLQEREDWLEEGKAGMSAAPRLMDLVARKPRAPVTIQATMGRYPWPAISRSHACQFQHAHLRVVRARIRTLGLRLRCRLRPGHGMLVIGPRSLQQSRMQYNEVVKTTSEEELLLNIVRLRYTDTPSSLQVSNIAAQFELLNSLGITPFFAASGAEPNRSFTSLLPQASIAGADRPTFSLTPLDESEFARSCSPRCRWRA